jgi:hypothetical protein
LFHEGTWLSGFRSSTPEYVTVNQDTYNIEGEFQSLENWYRKTVRAEFAERYGLRPDTR